MDLGLGWKVAAGDVVERGQALGVGAGRQDVEHPVEERHAFDVGPEAGEGRGRERCVAQPAVAEVPVADAAEVLGQAHRRSDDGARRAVAETLQGECAAADELAPMPGSSSWGEPRAPETLGLVASIGFGPRVLAQGAGAGAKLPRAHRTVRQIGNADRSDIVAVGHQGPFDPGERSTMEVGSAHDGDAVVADFEPCRETTEVEPRCELDVAVPPLLLADAEHSEQIGAAGEAL
ncbi:MAG: hypothetical protein R2710_24705 [Acidimicrobiales bacterium]